MTLERDYTFDEALDELEALIQRIVVHEESLAEFERIIADSRARDTVPIRGIQQKLTEYRKEHSLYTPLTDAEKKLVENLIYIWG